MALAESGVERVATRGDARKSHAIWGSDLPAEIPKGPFFDSDEPMSVSTTCWQARWQRQIALLLLTAEKLAAKLDGGGGG